MRQALHIFQKDVRQFWREIALVLAITALFAALGIRRAAQPQYMEQVWFFSTLLLPIGWWFLISRVIHAEALPGARQFWMTRPYEWRSLLSAKAMFVIAFANLPMLLADVIILRAFGFQLRPLLTGLLCKQVMITAAFLLPSAALAVLTTGIVQVLLVLMAIAVGFVAFTWLDIQLIGSTLLIGVLWFRWFLCAISGSLAALFIVIVQYWKRRTVMSVAASLLGLIVVAVVAAHTPWAWALAIQSRLSHEHLAPSQVSVALNPQLSLASRAIILKGDRVEIHLPFDIGVPTGMSARVDVIGFRILAPDGATFQYWSRVQPDDTLQLRMVLPGSFYRKIKDSPLKVHGRAYVTLYGRPEPTTIPPNQTRTAAPNRLCSASTSEDVRSALQFSIEIRS